MQTKVISRSEVAALASAWQPQRLAGLPSFVRSLPAFLHAATFGSASFDHPQTVAYRGTQMADVVAGYDVYRWGYGDPSAYNMDHYVVIEPYPEAPVLLVKGPFKPSATHWVNELPAQTL